MDEAEDLEAMIVGFVADLPAEVRRSANHLSAKNELVFYGSRVITETGGVPRELLDLTPEQLVGIFAEVQIDVMTYHVNGDPWPLCPEHGTGVAEPHSVDPEALGWRCPNSGRAWPYGFFAGVTSNAG